MLLLQREHLFIFLEELLLHDVHVALGDLLGAYLLQILLDPHVFNPLLLYDVLKLHNFFIWGHQLERNLVILVGALEVILLGWQVLPFIIGTQIPLRHLGIEVRVFRVEGVRRDFLPTLLPDESFQLLSPHLLQLNDLLSLPMDPIIRIQLLLQLYDSFISLVEPACECYHDISLLQEELLVPVYLGLVFLYLAPFFLDVLELQLVLLPDHPLLFLQGTPELWCILHLLPSH
mmetsp:Transcript_29520/g.28683  ORF Transcript_29520/g.28683 Transcript_29520/m.28683 type:complete len:232 (+) Transcript_29520:603-1298(+)